MYLLTTAKVVQLIKSIWYPELIATTVNGKNSSSNIETV